MLAPIAANGASRVYNEPDAYNPPPDEEAKPPMTPESQGAPPAGKPPTPRTRSQRQAIFPVSEGDVTITFPAELSAEGFEELGQYLDIFLKKQRKEQTKGN